MNILLTVILTTLFAGLAMALGAIIANAEKDGKTFLIYWQL